jgi:hypothetical protein
MRRMRWFKLAAIAGGILIAFLVVGGIIGAVIHALTDLLIAALVVGGIVVAIKVMRSRNQVSGKRADREVREPEDYGSRRPLPRTDVEHVQYQPPPTAAARPSTQDVDDELARLKREMGS